MVNYLNGLFRVSEIHDKSANGLQVQGSDAVSKIGLAVDACIKVYEKAAENNCQMLIVHHGLIWGELKTISGYVLRHISLLIENNINLYGCHLPLDLHEELGNNIQLAGMLNLDAVEKFGEYEGIPIGIKGILPDLLTAKEIGNTFKEKLDSPTMLLPFGKEKNSTVGMVSGGGSSILQEAVDAGIDCFVTGESSHMNYHTAIEGEINVVYIGHYHSEKPGVQALGRHLEEYFKNKIETVFLDEPTPI